MSNDKKNMNIEETRDLVIAGAKELMKRFKAAYGTKKSEYRVGVTMDMGTEQTVESVHGWADCSLTCLETVLRKRMPHLGIYCRTMSYEDAMLTLEVHVFAINTPKDPFADIDEQVDDNFC